MKKGKNLRLKDGKSGKSKSPGIIYSGNMGPCISIGIYDKNMKIGHMIHKSNADNSDEVVNFLDETLKTSNLKDLDVCVAGGGIDSNEDEDDPLNINDDIQSSRDYVEGEILKRFEKLQVKFKWNDSSKGVELILDTSTGQFTLEYDDEQDHDD